MTLSTEADGTGTALVYMEQSPPSYAITPTSPYRKKIDAAGTDYAKQKAQLANPENLPLVVSQSPKKLLAELREENEQFVATKKALGKRGREILKAIEDGEIDCQHPDDIICEVLEKHGFKYIYFISLSRADPIAKCRHEVFYRLRHETPLSLPLIGAICRRDHTTVHHGIRVHEQRLFDGTAT